MLRRNGFYTVRVHVPLDLRPLIRRRELWRSTLTNDHRIAKLRASIFTGRAGELFVRLRREHAQMTRDQIDALVSQYLDRELNEAETRLATGAWDVLMTRPGQPGDWNEFGRTFLADQLKEIERALAYNDLGLLQLTAARMLPGADEPTRKVLARRLLEAQHNATLAELQALQGKPLPRPQVSRMAAPVPPAPAPSGPPLSKVCADYIASVSATNKWAAKTRLQNETAVGLLVGLVGDKPISAVTKDDMRAAHLQLTRVPSNATKRYPKLTVLEAIAAADKAGDEDRLQERTRNTRLQVWKSIFLWATNNDLLAKSPADPLKDFQTGKGQDARAAFTDGQLTGYFGLLRAEQGRYPAHLGIALSMLYGGLRLEEAAALRAKDVREQDGVLVFDINTEAGQVKTDDAVRLVPVHSAIREYVLRVQADVKPEGNLWGLTRDSRGRMSHNVSKAMNRRLHKLYPADDKLVVYSLRHTFATRLKDANVQEFAISELMGHVVEALSVGRYGKKLQVHRLREAVEMLSVPALLEG